MKQRERGNEYRTTVICVDDYTNGVPSGRLYNPFWEEGVCFSSTVDFLQKMESLLDGMDFPQAFTVKRSFGPIKPMASYPAEEGVPGGARGTFFMKVLFRQNSSWQGSVVWLEGKREESFRSVLELIFLMDGALTA